MLRMRHGNWRTNHGESNRMYPARQTRSTWCFCSVVTTSRSCSARSLPCDGITSEVSPRLRAVSSPRASVRLEITTAMRASGIRPAATFLAMASKLEPRPERSMPRFFIEGSECQTTMIIQPSLFCLSRGLAHAEQLRPDFQRQRISAGQRPGRSELSAAGLLANHVSRDATVASGEQQSCGGPRPSARKTSWLLAGAEANLGAGTEWSQNCGQLGNFNCTKAIC